MSHKLCTYILAQDKKAKKDGKSKDKKKKKEDSDEEKKKKKKEKKDKDSDGEKDKEKKKKKKEKKDKDGADEEKKKKKKKEKKDKDADEEKKKDEDLVDEMNGLGFDGTDDASAMLLAIEGTKKFLLDNPDASPEEILEQVVNQQMASALKSFDKMHIFVQAAITPDFFKLGLIAKYAPVFSLITNNNPIMERHLIAALEWVSIDNPKHFPVLIKQLFDEDALEEDTILEWASEGRSDYTVDAVSEETRAILRGEAEPVVVWLQDDDSDEDD